ncbi:hypothetical protein KM043_013371 [Ampulex compressa]|nr:hypothetical protein KM043_013371 [Ampulex compressa]
MADVALNVLNKNQRGRKFQAKSDEYVLVGYSEESKAYRLWKLLTKTVIKARDVKFFERIESSSECSTGRAFAVPNTFIKLSHKEANDTPDNQITESEDSWRSMDDMSDHHITELENSGPGRPRIDRTDPKSIPHILKRDDKEVRLVVMKKEYNTLQENKTWILVPRPADKKILTN